MSENNPTSPVSPLAVYPPQPPTEVRSRAPEFYGFVAWSLTYLLYCFFLLWALLPDTYLIRLGISWYPSRQVSIPPSICSSSQLIHVSPEWALLLPAYTVVLVLLTYCAYLALALAGTPSFSDVSTLTDSKAHLPDADVPTNPYLSHARPNAIPVMYDIPIGMVNRVIYSVPSRQGGNNAAAPPGESRYARA
ncbi:PIG-P-domain-containing protein [Irpex rosettiformis]|uniref:PIG-P-domain-containing protein n=1 Tax=Irpex rosettiformis TaxID=378272 RepID=A0ACB8TZ83_9APHY|nr:PIG-P-domain-containing protein [Irpex rosettiformis]